MTRPTDERKPLTIQSRLTLAACATLLLCTHIARAQSLEESFTLQLTDDRRWTPDPAIEEEISDKVQAMSLRERVAQLMFITLEGLQAPAPADRDVIENYTPGGAILRRLLQPKDTVQYITELRRTRLEVERGVPMFIGTNLYSLGDVEGLDSVQPVQLPTLFAMAAANNVEASEGVAAIMSDLLNTMGFNLHFGPSLELAPEVATTVGSLDNFGSRPAFVARAGVSLIEGLQREGIIAVPVGFPGGGQNHFRNSPAVLLTPRPHLNAKDVLPFAEAVRSGASVVHVSNVLIPTIENAQTRASESRVVMETMLRRELDFEGVILAGPIDVDRTGRARTPSQTAVLSLMAGADMLLWNRSGVLVMKTVEDVLAAVNDGLLSQARVDEAVARILTVKAQAKVGERPLPKSKDVERKIKKYRSPEEVYEVERRSITLIQNRGQLLPLTKKESMPIGVTGVIGVEELHDALEKHIQPIAQQVITTAKHTGQVHDFEISRVTDRVKGIRTAICVLSGGVRIEGQVELIRALRRKGVRVVVVLLGYPAQLPAFTSADAIVLGYTQSKNLEENMRAIGDVLVGRSAVGVVAPTNELRAPLGEEVRMNAMEMIFAPTGRLPVAIGNGFDAGHGVSYNPTHAFKNTEWDFGDGHRSNEIVANHRFQEVGRYPVSLTVTDRQGFESSATFHVVVK